MKKLLLIGAAVLIAGAATVAIAADHKGRKGTPQAMTCVKPAAPAKNPAKVATARASSHKATPAKAHGSKHHARHHRVTHRAK